MIVGHVDLHSFIYMWIILRSEGSGTASVGALPQHSDAGVCPQLVSLSSNPANPGVFLSRKWKGLLAASGWTWVSFRHGLLSYRINAGPRRLR